MLTLDQVPVDDFVKTLKTIATSFAGFHLEDIAAPRCFEIEEKLAQEVNIPVYRDDQEGTAIVVLAALINTAKVVNKNLTDLHVLLNGVGASGVATARLLLEAGIKNLTLVDIDDPVSKDDQHDNQYQREVAAKSAVQTKFASLDEAIFDQDVFIGLSDANVLSATQVKKMAAKPIIFALSQVKQPAPSQEQVAAIVMNANPFTKGYRYLVEQAASQSALVYLFVVSNDVSLFKTRERKELVAAGVSDLTNVVVVDCGDYQISPATFPAYFLKSDQEIGDCQAHLYAQLFATQIAPALKITACYVGTEPHSKTTANYNRALAEVLAPHVKLHVIERCQDQSGVVISATRVRQAIKDGELARVQDDLPPTTFAFIHEHLASLQARITTQQKEGFLNGN